MADDAARDGDERLLDRVRAGDEAAYEQLYREHVDGARHLARILAGADQADELVAESFARVLGQLRAGRGPTSSFRAYLHVTIRNGYRDGLRAPREAPASDQPWVFDLAGTEPPPEDMVEGLDEAVAVEALSRLPESWRQVLWHLEVEGRKPAEVAVLMDLKPRAVSSLAHRAREGLKRAYLDLHAGPAPDSDQCRWTHARMSRYARGDLGTRAEHRIRRHLDDCPNCSVAFAAVGRVNDRLAAYVLPAVLLGAAPASGNGLAWLAAAAGGTTTAGGAAGSASSGGPVSGVSTFGGPVGITAAATVAVGVIAAGALAMTSGEDVPRRAPKRPVAEAVQTPQPEEVADPASGPAAGPVVAAPVDAVAGPVGASARPAVPPRTRPAAPTSSSAAAPTPSPDASPSDCATEGRACTTLTGVTVTRTGSRAWDVVTRTRALGGPDRTIEVRFRFRVAVTVPAGGVSGSGWRCVAAFKSGPVELGGERTRTVPGPLAPVSCVFDYTGTETGPLTLSVTRPRPAGSAPPSGTATLRSGADTASRDFSG